MVRICPTCLHPDQGGGITCSNCGEDLARIELCSGCGATMFKFANFCYHCGLASKAAEFSQSQGENTTNLDPSRGAEPPEVEDYLATTFRGHGVQLFHRPSTTFFDLPTIIGPVILGKRRDAFRPSIDLRDFSQSEFISRSHAQISWRHQQFYIEDLGSKNGTEVNGVVLPSGREQLLAFGDQIRLGNAEAFTFIFIKDQPINLDHLKMISGEDRAFEAELLTSYIHSVSNLIETLAPAILNQDFAEIKYLGNQIAIASHNVGADVMNLLAKQLEDQSLQSAPAACEKTLAILQEGLVQIRQFVTVFYVP